MLSLPPPARAARRLLQAGMLLACLSSLAGCTNWFFYPQRGHVQTPTDMGYRYLDARFTSADGVALHGWLVQPNERSLGPDSHGPRGTIYFLHGNAQNVSWHIVATRWLLEAGYQVFALDYRGFGDSAGKPAVPEVFFDISAGLAWLEQARIEGRPVLGEDAPLVLYGQSLGGSLALSWLAWDPAAAGHFDRVVTEAAFSRFGTIAREVAGRHWLTWLFQFPADWFITDDYEPVDALRELELPLMLVHSTEDEIVPFSHAQTLYRARPENTVLLVARGPHIRAFADPALRDQLLQWLAGSSEPDGQSR